MRKRYVSRTAIPGNRLATFSLTTSSSSANESPGLPADRRRNRDEACQHVRQLDAREPRAAVVLHDHRQVHAQVRDERKRVSGIERERRQHRMDVPAVVVVQVGLDRRGVVGRVEDPDAVRGQQRAQDVGPAALDVVHHPLGPDADGVELLLRAHAVRRQRLALGTELPQQRRHPDHEELVQVGRDDGEELHPLEQRVAFVLGLQQDALVELQPAQLAVDEQRRVLEVRGIRSLVGKSRGCFRDFGEAGHAGKRKSPS